MAGGDDMLCLTLTGGIMSSVMAGVPSVGHDKAAGSVSSLLVRGC